MRNKTEESRRTYNKKAFEYDTSKEGRYTRFHIDELVGKIVLKENDAVLDVACGNGTLLNALAKKEKVKAYGIDISENMIASARERYPNLNFIVGSCYPLHFADESIDIITVCCAFHHFSYPKEFIDECKRILKRNGQVYIADPNYSSIVRFLANHLIFPLSRSGDVKVYSREELEKFFSKSGFKNIKTYVKGPGLFLSAQK